MLTRPDAFLLFSYLHLEALVQNSYTITFSVQEIRTIGHRPVLKAPRVRKMLAYLQEHGFITINKKLWMKPIVEITILRREFPYV